ncbi:hypothetical protein JQ604_12080 [Bradyrhizobium jicamae]|uniref:hypothetical protein n=1 Tax=Bradyrhizobium jicamae TaxID=280332 RepID=UPI001BA91AEE|nr:hypothetical protein [Bradyrhizobium jicamae]MBR0752924.1 hypothetical protein [Bradyrhizobium jicamae]
MLRTVALPAAIASPSIAHSPDHLPDADRRLVELAARVAEIYPLYESALEEQRSVWSVYEQREPQRPAELAWRVGDPVGYEIEHTDDDAPERRGRVWCSAAAIEALRDNPLMRWEFVGTDDEWQRAENHRTNAESGERAPECAHLWKHVPDTKMQPRADQLIAALHRWEHAKDELQRDLGLPGLIDREQELYDQFSALQEEMLEVPATTLVGLRAKAMVLFTVCWQGDALDQLGDAMDSKFIYSLVGDLIGSRDHSGSWDGEHYRPPGGASPAAVAGSARELV